MSALVAATETERTPPIHVKAATGTLARIEVHDCPWPALRAWREVESFSTGTAYQSIGFVLPWYETIGRMAGAAPLVVVGYDAQDRPAVVLPLMVVRRGPVRIAMFAGGKHSNLNLPLMRPGATLDATDAGALLGAVAEAASPRVDLFAFFNQPRGWAGAANPFAALDTTQSPSFAYGATIGRDADAFLARVDSKATRKKLRSKAARLAEIGPLRFERAECPERARTILEAFVVQKTLRFGQKHKDPGFAHADVRAFLDALATGQCGGPLALDFYALSVGDRIVATYGGLPRGRNWHGLVNSFIPDADIARSSPAELLLRHLIRDLSARGVERFDLGVGESRYKSAICDETIELVDLVTPGSLAGRAWAPVERGRLAAKRWVKRTPWALSFVEQMRAGPT